MSIQPSIHQCPNCSRVVKFSSPHTTITVCVCGTVLNRMGDGTIIPRPFATVANTADVIAPGTTGQWRGRSFTVTGRFRIWADETVFSYWTILFQDDSYAYLLEGYGMYSICIPATSPPELKGDAIKNLKPGRTKLLNGEQYMMLRKDRCLRWEVEGECYMPECNSTFITFDFSSASGKTLHIIEYWPRVQPAFEVHHTDFTSLALQHTRPFITDGNTFKCTNCQQEIHVTTFPYSQSCACNSCGTQYVYEDLLRFARVAGSKQKTQPAITIGTTGIIRGISYKVIGFIVKEEKNKYKSQWREYTLFNEREGYAFLSEFDGHWMYLREQSKTPVPEDMDTTGYNYEGESYDLFNAYHFSVMYAQGEFAANAFDDGNIKCQEFISPPTLWAREESPKEGIVWFKGWHVERSDLRIAFGEAITMPEQVGTGAVQPNGYVPLKKLFINTLIGIAVLIIIHMLATSGSSNRQILDKDVYFTDSTGVQTAVIGDLHLDKRRSNVKFVLIAPIENTWIELEATLVNKKTGSEYSVSQGIEFYTGFEDGERWSEGSHQAEFYINEVPAGDYTLELAAQREKSFSQVNYYTITAFYDVSSVRNLFICIGFLLLWPIFKYLRTYFSERKRWENSPYSRFISYESDN